MLFTATIATRSGERRKISRQAESAAALRDDLRADGMLVLDVAESSPSKGWLWRRRLSQFEIEMGLRQLSSLLKSGVSLVFALDTLASGGANGKDAKRNSPASRIWGGIHDKVMEGCRFADALKDSDGGFDELVVTLARTGEESGELDKSLRRAAEQLESRRELRLAVVNALAYPFLAVAMAIGVAVFLVVSVIPKISEFLVSAGSDLPEITRLMLDISDFIRNRGVLIVGAVAAAAAAWFALRRFAAAREAEDAFLLKIPVTGRILRLSGIALTARSMQMLLDSGVTLIMALDAVSALPKNRRFRRRLAVARDRVQSGATLADAMADAKEFPPLFKRMVAVGEHTGNLADAFGEAAYFHEGALRRAVKRFSMLIEPVMILVTALIVGFVYVAFFMALFSLSSAA